MSTTETARAVANHTVIPLDAIDPSPTNPRKRFDQAGLEELARSIQEHGIIQPVIVREVHSGRYELIAGERRLRAAQIADLGLIPAIVRDLSDAEVLEVQITENLQRADLHPLEEAESYEQLQRLHEYSVEDLAAKVGKSRGYVYARMKLCALAPEAREAFYAGKLNPSTALLVARIPATDLQAQAVREITADDGHNDGFGTSGEPMTVREAADHIQDKYMLRLKEAPFSTTDPDLVPEAGPCSTCPKRTGNQRELFGDVQSPDVCTDPTCFSAKKEALWVLRQAEANLKDQFVLTDKDAKKLFALGRLRGNTPYVDLAERCEYDSKGRTWRAVLGKSLPAVFIVRNPETGLIHELVSRDKAEEHARTKMPAVSKEIAKGQKAAASSEANLEKWRAKEALRTRVFSDAMGEVVAAAERRAPDVKFWRLLAGIMLTNAHLENADGRRAGMQVKAVATLSEAQLRGLVLELSLSHYDALSDFIRGDKRPGLSTACEVLGVDLKKLEATAKAALAAGDKTPDEKEPEPTPIPAKKKTKTAPKAEKAAAPKKKGKR